MASSDFESGVYQIAGVSKSFTDLWMQDITDGNGTWASGDPDTPPSGWNPAGVVPGTGLTITSAAELYNSPSATPALIAALGLADGVTMLIDYTMDEQASENTPRIQIEVADDAFANEWEFLHDGDHHINLFAVANSASVLNDAVSPATTGSFKAAITLGPDFLGYSLNGAATHVAPAAPPSFDANKLWLHLGIAHGTGGPTTSTVTIRSIKFYMPQPAEILPWMSA